MELLFWALVALSRPHRVLAAGTPGGRPAVTQARTHGVAGLPGVLRLGQGAAVRRCWWQRGDFGPAHLPRPAAATVRAGAASVRAREIWLHLTPFTTVNAATS